MGCRASEDIRVVSHGPPVNKVLGCTPCLVSGSNGGLVVVVSAPGHPAMPFYFMLLLDPSGKRRVIGVGTGGQDRECSDHGRADTAP